MMDKKANDMFDMVLYIKFKEPNIDRVTTKSISNKNKRKIILFLHDSFMIELIY